MAEVAQDQQEPGRIDVEAADYRAVHVVSNRSIRRLVEQDEPLRHVQFRWVDRVVGHPLGLAGQVAARVPAALELRQAADLDAQPPGPPHQARLDQHALVDQLGLNRVAGRLVGHVDAGMERRHR